MSNYKFYVLGNYSPNIRTFGKLNSSCYMLIGFDKTIFLDFGAGVFKKIKYLIKRKKLELNNILIIISHNHVDHNYSLLDLYFFLKEYNKKNNTNISVDIVMPHRSVLYDMAQNSDIFNIIVLNENLELKIGEAKFSFCPTIHKGESYATKIECGNKVFVYTSDIARYSKRLSDFIQGADTVMVDAGYPRKKFKLFRNYHGITKEILKETASHNVKKIYATHIRFFSNFEDYLNSFPSRQNVELVSIGNEYRLFK